MLFNKTQMLNPNGTEHHIAIREGDAAKRLLLVSTPEEVQAVLPLCENMKQVGDNREYVTFTGTYKGVPISVASSGNGCMPMAIAVEEFCHVGVKSVIKAGFGGALQPGVKPGALFAATAAVRGEGATLEYVPIGYPAVCDMGLLDRILDAGQGETIRAGIFRSHDAYYLESPFSAGAAARVNPWRDLGVELIEHETAALFVLSTIFNLKAGALYTAESNLTDGGMLSEAELAARLKTVYSIALDALAGEETI